MMKATSFSSLLNVLLVLVQFIHLIDANWITGNLCWSMPCLNGGSCFGSAYTYLCVCPINYSGALCEKRLGICQEKPCGNRGLCVETGLTSFECRCYFDYMGPLCEEHIPKDDPTVWTSLIPVHTRVLLDFLQEAYHAKAQSKSTSNANDFSGKQHIVLPTSTIPSTISTSTIPINEEAITQNLIRDTTEPEHVILAENIQLEKIFPEISTASTDITEITTPFVSTTFTSSPTIESNETSEMATFSTTATTTITTVTSTETTVLTTIVTEDNSTTSLTTTTIESKTSESTTESVTNATEITIATMTMNNNVINVTDSDHSVTNTTVSLTDEPSTTFETTTIITSTQTESTEMPTTFMSSSTSSSITESAVPVEDLLQALNKSETIRNRLLYKLCRQLLSQIFPNTSLSSINSETAMSLTSNSSLMMNHTATALLSWIQEQLNSTSISTTLTTTMMPSTMTTTMAITTATITTTTTIPVTTTTIAETTTTITTISTTPIGETTTSVIELPLIHGRKFGSALSLQRVNMDEALGWANDPMDVEH